MAGLCYQQQGCLSCGCSSEASNTRSTGSWYHDKKINEVGPSDIESEVRRRQEFALRHKPESGLRMNHATAHISELCPEGLYKFTVRLQLHRQVLVAREELQKRKRVMSIVDSWQQEKLAEAQQQVQDGLRKQQEVQDSMRSRQGRNKELYGEILALTEQKHALLQQRDTAPIGSAKQHQYIFTKRTARRVAAAPPCSKLSDGAALFAPKLSAEAAPFIPKAPTALQAAY